MLSYIAFYVLASILILQGTQLLGELTRPLGTVPAEVKPNPLPAARIGGFLVTFGAASVVAGLLSHLYPWFQGSLGLLHGAGILVEAVFGVWLVFGRKVDYLPAPVADTPAHGHH
ncbi:hypothetical protein [Mesoterricola sediminis]|uniref:Uncharacterized protein n=1 Tax=Mesoterricola sediminis TaxID=2927980 RepID=A0AA48GX14_9BACT|nr:hypothetical protein [Mesoterricola sediminis]BDU75632.1 hypothetical protein METESE_05900 [Mesoterricola sediminis]